MPYPAVDPSDLARYERAEDEPDLNLLSSWKLEDLAIPDADQVTAALQAKGIEPEPGLMDAIAEVRKQKDAYDYELEEAERRIACCDPDDYWAQAERSGALYAEGLGSGLIGGFARSLVGDVIKGRLRKKFAWSIPTPAAIVAIANHSPILEIGAGSGYWAYLLRKHGADVLAYDRKPYRLYPDAAWHHTPAWTGVTEGRARKAKKFPERSLMLCWPPQKHHLREPVFRLNLDPRTNPMPPAMAQERLAYDALTAYRGETVIYIGQTRGGCTATDEFFDVLDRDWTLVTRLPLPGWNDNGGTDYLSIYGRVS